MELCFCLFQFGSGLNSFLIRLCPSKEKERNIACIFKIIVWSFIYTYMYICIYIDPVIAMLFISAFSDLFSRKHNQVVKKLINPLSKSWEKCFFPFCLLWIHIQISMFYLGLIFFFFLTRTLDTFYGWLKSNHGIMVYKKYYKSMISTIDSCVCRSLRSAAHLISTHPHYLPSIRVLMWGRGKEKVGGSSIVLSYWQENGKILLYPTSAGLWSHQNRRWGCCQGLVKLPEPIRSG